MGAAGGEGAEDLAAFLRPDETAAQLLARCRVEPLDSGVAFLGALRPGQVVELVGPSGSAKSDTLLQARAPAAAAAARNTKII